MGIAGLSAHKSGGAMAQVDRMHRWHQRLLHVSADEALTSADRLDFFLAFAQNCYSVRDWLQRDGRAQQAALDTLMSETTVPKICRDIANGSKHLVISKPSIDADFSIGREYQGQDRPERSFVVAGTDLIDALDFSSQCVRAWDSFLAMLVT